jgi:gas vesicle protein GvpO
MATSGDERSGDGRPTGADKTSGSGSDDGRLSAIELSQAALATVQELTGYQPEAVTALEWDGEVWQVTVDVLELARIPNTTDLLGSYAVQLDEQGTLRGYRRIRRFQRGQMSEE